MDDKHTAYPRLTALARRTGVEEYKLVMFATLAGPAAATALTRRGR